MRSNTRIAVTMLILLAAALAISASAGTGALQGTVQTTSGQYCGEDEVRAHIQGSSTTATTYDYGRIYWDGIYRIPEGGTGHNSTGNLSPGTYSVGMSDEYEWRPRNYSYVQVVDGQTTPCNMTVSGTYEVRNQNGTTPTKNEIGQTFVAKGGSVQRLTLWQAQYPYTITFHDGGRGGSQVGPARTVYNSSTQTWNYGEIPTVAGRTYYVKLYRSNGFSTYCNSNNPYSSGVAYFNNQPQSGTDLMMTLFEDCDGQASMYHVHLANTSTSNFFAGEIGQTFKSLGANLLSFSLRLRTGTGSPKTAVCTVHSGGRGGAQVGPSKATTVYDYNPVGQKVTFTWLPGEVQLTSGSTYYIRVSCPNGLYVWCSTNNIYSDGCAYEGSTAKTGDLIGTIMGEVSTNSSTCLINGTVVDGGGPISGVTLFTDNCGYSTTTDANGDYSLRVTGDAYDITCAKTGYQTTTLQGYDADCGTTDTVNFTLTATGSGTITGSVKDSNNNNLSGATVSTSPGDYSATTDVSGNYTISNVPVATYGVTASKSGYSPQTQTGVVVNANQTTTCNFTLDLQGTTISEEFGSMPAWSSSYDATWGSAATWSIVSGGQSGNFLQASRSSGGSSVKVKVYSVPQNTNMTISIYMKCPSFGGTYWMESGYKLGSYTAQDFDQNSGTWTIVKKFDNSGTNGNGNTWTQYSTTVNTGANTQISIGYKLGSTGSGPTVGWDTLSIQ